jgi:drug/metabolite transporter (DMT)-like permease
MRTAVVTPRTSAVPRPPRADVLLLAVAVMAVSTSGPLMASAAVTVPVLAIAMWRNALSLVVLGPATLLRRRPEVRALPARELRFAGAAGFFLALHFATWVPSLNMTSVASATALVATQPVWQAVIARLQGHHVSRQVWVGIGLAVVGAGWLSGADFSVSSRSLQGDGLAAAAAVFAAVYIAYGGEVRRTVSSLTYTTICYTVAALVLLAICLVGGVRLGGWSALSWWKLVAITAGAQLLGHSVFSLVLRTTSPTVVSLTILLEVPGAALLAWVWLGQVPRLTALPGALLLLAGIAVVAVQGVRAEEASPV